MRTAVTPGLNHLLCPVYLLFTNLCNTSAISHFMHSNMFVGLHHYVGTFSRPLYEVVTNETFYFNVFSISFRYKNGQGLLRLPKN